ncbi:MAG: ATP-dependent helicase HrpB [Bacteroidia bacterium]|nr:ATP-dependent helicase HrpB [Bacteroidia bacterium]
MLIDVHLGFMLPDYPIQEIIPELKAQLQKQTVLILQAPPGAGKSTVLPIQLLNEKWLGDKKIIMLEPRRLAARSVANRMASLLDDDIGNTVGYRVRFENKVGKQTKIEVVTEGILTRMLQNDNALENVGLVIFDEFHERSLNADLALALCLQVQQILRDDLKILIMSATLDGAKLSSLLNNAPILTSEGRQFPVTLKYEAVDDKTPVHINMSNIIKKALREQEGDILAFLPGAGEIQRTQQLLEEHTSISVFPLYGDLSPQKQQEAILPDPHGMRKVVLATSIAETSLTIEGITTVIDCGFSRVPKFDARSGFTKLETVKITKDAADQRAGRAGRLGPGVCYRLWSEGAHIHLLPNRKPEILEADLAPLMLELSEWGISNINDLLWLNLPPQGNVAQAKELLQQLGAILNNAITARGKEMLQMPTHPRIAHLLIEAKHWQEKSKINYTALAADVAALLEERDPLQRESGTDITLRIEALRKYRNKEFVNADKRVLDRIERLALSWRKLLRTDADNSQPDVFAVGKLIAAAYPERVAKRIDKNELRYRLANGRTVKILEQDALHQEEYIAIAQLDAGTNEGKVFSAAPLNAADLKDLAIEQEKISWDKERGIIVATIDKCVGGIVLESKSITKISEEQRIRIICEAIRNEGLKLIGWGEQEEDLQARILSLKKWRTQENWNDVSNEHLLDTLEEWLGPYLTNINKQSELKQLNLCQIITSSLPWELASKLDALAPSKIEVPSGSMIKVSYFADGRKPEMAVRLQELFGLLETPAVNEGKNQILLHLLSPGYKPVQVTQDLNSFWNKTYFEVRKDLLSRYPKHSWPENPLTAEAVRGVKRKK